MIPPLPHWVPNPASLIKAGLGAKKIVSSNDDESNLLSGSALTAVCMLLEQVIAKALEFDPATQHKLPYLKGKVLALRLTSPNLHLFVGVVEDEAVGGEAVDAEAAGSEIVGGEKGCEIRITQYSDEVTTELSGRCLDMLRLLRQSPVSLANTGVQVRGSTALLQQWMAIFKGLDIDWEDALIQQLGSLPGHQLAEVIRVLMRSQARHGRQFYDLTARFFDEEADFASHPVQFETLKAHFQRLREEVDQLIAQSSRS